MCVGFSLVIHWLAWLRIISVIDNHKYVPFIKVTIQSFFSLSLLITLFSTRVVRRVPLVKQELFIIPENSSSYSFFCGLCCSIFCFLCIFLWLMLLNLLFSVWCFVHHCLGVLPFFLLVLLFWFSNSDYLYISYDFRSKEKCQIPKLNFLISPKFLLKFFTALFEQILQNHDLCFRQC